MGAVLFAAPGASMWSECSMCTNVDAAEWIFCLEDERSSPSQAKSQQQRRRRAKGAASEVWTEGSVLQRMEELTKELFRLHDLNGNGVLEEAELVSLNEKIAILHHGQDTDTQEVRSKYRDLFRAKLDPLGRPVPYEKFRTYAREMLDGLDTDLEAQEMILEQFVAEAQSGRQAINCALISGDHELPKLDSRTLDLDIPSGSPRTLQPAAVEEPPELPRLSSGTIGPGKFGPMATESPQPAGPSMASTEDAQELPQPAPEGCALLAGRQLLPLAEGSGLQRDQRTALTALSRGEKLVLTEEPRALKRADSDPVLDLSSRSQAMAFCAPLHSGRSSNISN